MATTMASQLKDEETDIDAVLKESEALLDRLQRANSQSDRDTFDGAASLTSLASLGSLLNGSVKELTTPKSVISSKRKIEVSVPPQSSDASATPLVSPLMSPRLVETPPSTEMSLLDQLIPDLETAPTMPMANTLSSAASDNNNNPPPSPGRPPQWEKVSSAAQGDDDYVPLVDYSKLTNTNNTASQQRPVLSSKVSRLEAYRKKAQRKRRRRRRIGIALAIVLLVIYFIYSRRSRGSTRSLNDEGKNQNVTWDAAEDGTLIAKESMQFEESGVGVEGPVRTTQEEQGGSLDPEIDLGDFHNLLDEIDSANNSSFGIENVIWEDQCDGEESEVKEDDFQEEISEDRDISAVGDNEESSSLSRKIMPSSQDKGVKLAYCQHPFAKFLSKTCQGMTRERKRPGLHSLVEKPMEAMVENPVFLVI